MTKEAKHNAALGGSATLAQGIKTARTIRRCSNRHPILPGDRIVYWTGKIDGIFSPWEECSRCVTLGWGMPWLSRFWDDER